MQRNQVAFRTKQTMQLAVSHDTKGRDLIWSFIATLELASEHSNGERSNRAQEVILNLLSEHAEMCTRVRRKKSTYTDTLKLMISKEWNWNNFKSRSKRVHPYFFSTFKSLTSLVSFD